MFILITFMHDTNIFFFVTNHTPSGKKNSGDLNAGEKPTLFCLAITNLIPTFVFAFPTNPCLHLMLHHYTPYPFFPTLPSAIFKQNNPSIILPTFRYTILHPLSTMLRSVIWYTSQLCNCKPSTIILPIFWHTKLHSLSTFNYTMLYTTSHNSVSPSAHQPLYLDLHAAMWFATTQFYLPETLYTFLTSPIFLFSV